MKDLVKFLTARLDEDEAYARNAFGDHNAAGPEWREQWSGALNIGDGEDLIMTNDSQVSRFMERNDPARALREVATKRAIIAMCLPDTLTPERYDTWQEALCHLAAVYSNRPDFRPEWLLVDHPDYRKST